MVISRVVNFFQPRWPLELLRGSQAPRRAVCGTRGSLFPFMRWRRKWQPTPVFLPGESQGRGSLMGCRLWGCTELDTLIYLSLRPRNPNYISFQLPQMPHFSPQAIAHPPPPLQRLTESSVSMYTVMATVGALAHCSFLPGPARP